MMRTIVIVLIAELFTAFGQVLLKMSANSADGSHNLRRVDHHINFLKDVLSKPLLWGGFVTMGIGLVVWIVALAGADLSIVFSLGSMQYILILVLAHYMLGEKIDRMKVLGTFLVTVGIVIIALS